MPGGSTTGPIALFCSYSHQDESLHNELSKHLYTLRRAGFVREWYDREILAGEEWDRQISRHLESAEIILLLISADFLASKYCYDIEAKRALERHLAGQAQVIPIILRPVVWSLTPFAALQALPAGSRPVTEWPDMDLAFVNICEGILAVVVARRDGSGSPNARPPAVAERPLAGTVARLRKRVMDAALPSHVDLNRATVLVVMLRREDSAGLRAIVEVEKSYGVEAEDVRSTASFPLEFPVDSSGHLAPLDLDLEIEAPDFAPTVQRKSVSIPPKGDSEPKVFLLTPKREGELLLTVQLRRGDKDIASCLLKTRAEQAYVVLAPPPGHNLVSVVLEVADDAGSTAAALPEKGRARKLARVRPIGKHAEEELESAAASPSSPSPAPPPPASPRSESSAEPDDTGAFARPPGPPDSLPVPPPAASDKVSDQTRKGTPMRKRSLKDSWWVLIAVPIIVALVPLVNTLLERGSAPSGTSLVQNNNFSGPMYFTNVSVVEQQYQQTAGQPLKDEDAKKKIEQAGKLVADKNFAAAAPILAEVAQRVPVAAVYNNLGVAYANSNDLARAEEAFRQAVSKEPNDQAAWVNLGLVQQKQGKLAEALASFQKAPGQSVAAGQIKAISRDLSGHDIRSAKLVPLDAALPDVIAADTSNYFKFTTPPKYRDVVEISVTNRSTTLEPWLQVFNSDKTNISGYRYNPTPGADFKYSFAADPNTTYYIAVGGHSETSGDYTLSIKPLKAYDRYEPNDDILHASTVDLGKPIEANIMDAQDVDYYRFTSPSRAGNIEVAIQNRSTTLEPWLQVFNSDKTNISGYRFNPTAGADLKYSFAVDPNATYYVAVGGNSQTSGDYTLTLKPQ